MSTRNPGGSSERTLMINVAALKKRQPEPEPEPDAFDAEAEAHDDDRGHPPVPDEASDEFDTGEGYDDVVAPETSVGLAAVDEPADEPAPEPPAERVWRPFSFANLEKVPKSHMQLLSGLEWMLPNVRSTGEVSQALRRRLHEMIDQEVSLHAESVHVVTPAKAKRYVSDPTFLAVLAPLPHKTRGLLEVELGLAHMVIDMLLGGAGEAVALRPLTDIEEGVLTYVLLEALKVVAPSVDPSLPRLRLESVGRSFEEVMAAQSEDEHLAVVQLKCVVANHAGYIRLFIPESVLSMSRPAVESGLRRARRTANAQAHSARLAHVKVWLRAEIGRVEISGADLQQLREGDVILVDGLSVRPDRGEGGTSTLKLGYGRAGVLNAEITVEDGRYVAKVTDIVIGDQPTQAHAPEDDTGSPPVDGPLPDEQDGGAEAGSEEEPAPPVELGEGVDESTSPGQKQRSNPVENPEGADLLNDVPLQIAVELGRVAMNAEQVVGLKVGHVIDLNRSAGEPLDLSVNGKVVARGELVEVDGNLGVRILSLAG